MRNFVLALIVFLLAPAFLFSQKVTYRYHDITLNGKTVKWQLPNRAVSPGIVRTKDLKELCDKSFRTGKFRHTTHKMKVDVCHKYGIMTGCPGPNWELDHIISLTVGGADEEGNLFPQDILQARIKDKLERTLGTTHGLVCQGKVPIEQAQEWLANDWVTGYEMVFHKAPVTHLPKKHRNPIVKVVKKVGSVFK